MYILQYPVNGYFDVIQDFSNETYKYVTDVMNKIKIWKLFFRPICLYIISILHTIFHTLNFKIDRNT